MASGNAARAASAVSAMLAQGLRQDARVLAYMTAAHGGCSLEDFAAALAEPDSPEARSLAALLLTPGMEQLAWLEPDLEAAGCSEDEAAEAAVLVEAGNARARALLPGGEALDIPLEPGDLAALTAKLRLEHAPPAPLAAVLNQRHPSRGALLKARLRHCRLEWTHGRVFFLAGLLGAMDPGHQDLEEALSWSIDWLGSLPPDLAAAERLPERLGEKHAELADRLRRAVAFHAALEKSGYEVMMAQGARVSLPHPDLVRREMEIMDLVCQAVTGRPCWTLAGLSHVDLGNVDDEEDLLDALGGV